SRGAGTALGAAPAGGRPRGGRRRGRLLRGDVDDQLQLVPAGAGGHARERRHAPSPPQAPDPRPAPRQRGLSRAMAERKRVEPKAPARVMSIHAHPDDQEFTIAGTLAKWARAGSEIVTVCLTSGDAGSNDSTPPDMTREKLAPIRQVEQRRACQVLGIKEC